MTAYDVAVAVLAFGLALYLLDALASLGLRVTAALARAHHRGLERLAREEARQCRLELARCRDRHPSGFLPRVPSSYRPGDRVIYTNSGGWVDVADRVRSVVLRPWHPRDHARAN